MIGIGIDIGSTATKAVVANDTGDIVEKLVMPTGFSSVEAADEVAKRLQQAGYDANELPAVATGYGRIAVPYANKVVTEITCHARGAWALFAEDGTVVDVGGQDTKAIGLAAGKVRKFVMNDKCSAGTGRFLEIMADRLGVSQQELARLAAAGQPTVISNMCSVFAESEVISLVARESRVRTSRAASSTRWCRAWPRWWGRCRLRAISLPVAFARTTTCVRACPKSFPLLLTRAKTAGSPGRLARHCLLLNWMVSYR